MCLTGSDYGSEGSQLQFKSGMDDFKFHYSTQVFISVHQNMHECVILCDVFFVQSRTSYFCTYSRRIDAPLAHRFLTCGMGLCEFKPKASILFISTLMMDLSCLSMRCVPCQDFLYLVVLKLFFEDISSSSSLSYFSYYYFGWASLKNRCRSHTYSAVLGTYC